MSKYKKGYVQGTFDLFHVGHLNLLRRAKENCEYLIVGIVSDELNIQYKNAAPYIPYIERAAVVAGCRYVDEVIKIDVGKDDKLKIWEAYHFDCHFCGDDHGHWEGLIAELHKRGSDVMFFPYTEATSSTKIREEVKRRILYHEDDVFSFDVFDTLITRDVATPVGIFAIVGQQLQAGVAGYDIPPRLCNGFFDIRIYAEQIARSRYTGEFKEDITIYDIYRVLQELENLSPNQVERIINLERELEIEHSLGIDSNIRELKKILNSGHRVILISDMYIDKITLRHMLAKADPVLSTIPLYISGECGVSKGLGNIYRYVQQREKIDIFHWVHTGDNRNSDISNAMELGIKTVYYNGASLTRREYELVRKYEDNVDIQLHIGKIRCSRLEGPELSLDGWLDRPSEDVVPYGIANRYPINILHGRVALYGAGKLGRAIYERLLVSNNHEIVCWVDKEAITAQKNGLPVQTVDVLLSDNYDEVVIGVASRDVAGDIRQELIDLGVVEEKIIWLERRG